MNGSLRSVGIVGSGAVAPLHLRAYRQLGVKVRALLAVDQAQADALCAEEGIAPRRVGDLDALVATDCDFFDVMVPPQQQPDIVARLCEAGRPILCEKPLALGLDAAAALVRGAERRKVHLGVMHNQLFYGAHVRARELIASKAVGEARLLRMHLVGFHTAHTAWKRSLQERGGMIWDDGIHRLYTAQSLFGPIEHVHARGHRDLAGPESGWAGSVHLRFAGGQMGVWDFSYALGGGTFYDDSLAVVGTRGVIAINGAFGRPWPASKFAVRTGDEWREEPVGSDWAGSFVELIRHFIEAAEAGRESELIGGRAVLSTVAAAEAVERSLREDRQVAVVTVPMSL